MVQLEYCLEECPRNKEIIAKVMKGYVTGRFKALKEKSPLGLFEDAEEKKLFDQLIEVEDDILATGYTIHDNIIPNIAAGYLRKIFPKDVRDKAEKCYRGCPGATYGIYSKRDFREVLSDPKVCKKATKKGRRFLEASYTYLESYIESYINNKKEIKAPNGF
ncbi:hypothetical protein JW756_05610 [Candidatus Woesearchaeota archaeon]|nr:hypothetical protein [Candidatus Woesearchaeota archaeon]